MLIAVPMNEDMAKYLDDMGVKVVSASTGVYSVHHTEAFKAQCALKEYYKEKELGTCPYSYDFTDSYERTMKNRPIHRKN